MRKKKVTYCRLKKIDTDMFELDLAGIDLKREDLDGIISDFET